MPTKIRINITTDVLNKSCFCLEDDLNNNCAIALAIRNIFPAGRVFLGGDRNFESLLHITGELCPLQEDIIHLPQKAMDFIMRFDPKDPHERRQMDPISFEIEISDNILERYFPIPEELETILSSSPTLELVEQP